jgi:SagB-type dehydrogenase family enzyme
LDRIEPAPRSEVKTTNGWRPRIRSSRELSAPSLNPDKAFIDVLDQRRSRRSFTEPSLDEIGRLLWHAARTRESGVGRLGLRWEHRAAPSAGGLHPLELFIQLSKHDTLLWYDPIRHCLHEVEVPDPDSMIAFRDELGDLLPGFSGAAITLAADLARTDAAYSAGESLLWRDAGCLMMVLHLVSEYLDLPFCPIGLLGDTLLKALNAPRMWIPAGVCAIGARGKPD